MLLQSDSLNIAKKGSKSRLDERKIIIIGMVESPHFQKWLKAMQNEFPKKKIIVFSSDRPHLDRGKMRTLRGHASLTSIFRLFPSGHLNFVTQYVLDNLLGLQWRAYFLARLIVWHRPAVIHFHEMQHGAYIYNLIANYPRVQDKSRKIISTWGSDLSLYSWVDIHKNQIRTCLNWADVLTAENVFENRFAEQLGFKGSFVAPVYITLGSSRQNLDYFSKPSSRSIILIKGYQDNPGRALNALNVIASLKDEIKQYQVIVYSAAEAVQVQVDVLRNRDQINILALPRIPHEQMKEYFAKARISISLAVSDGLPGALVEAMEMGALPIQSSNSAVGEFLIHGETGFIVDPWDLSGIKDAIKIAITSDSLVDNASITNREILQKKYSLEKGIANLKALYS
jgi:glycosyltransferase involved in cell wall biosynthesis